jgi:transitional endoplasmic reticulum ATPase
MLAPDFDERFGKIEEVIGALADSLKNDEGLLYDEAVAQQDEETACSLVCEEADEAADIPRGFSSVAGMDSLKQMLTDEVMYVLQNPDKVKRYRLKVPNGMLLYGPPGCGKTFIAEKFAQESRLNFMMVKAPTILCLDELDGMAPDRTRLTSEAVSGEVNEFLSQLNNCSERGIFVIGTTNRPNMIDPAIMRSGRMDHLIYIPMPDEQARKDLFKIHLAGRPCSDDIDLDYLARITDGYVASDIELIVNKTALAAAKRELPISQQLLAERICLTRKSVSESDRQSYDAIHRQMESSPKPQERRRIGFVTTNN